MVKPKASSTPKIVGITGRRPIGDASGDSVQSPIFNLRETQSPEKFFYPESDSQNSDECFDSNDETEEVSAEEIKDNTTFCNCVSLSWFIIMFVVIMLACILHAYSEEPATISVEKIAKEFPSQVEDFWISVETGIRDIIQLEQPKTFVFLYNDESRETLNEILNRITKLATCSLSNCTSTPVILEAKDLSAADILNDYGQVITRNKAKLEESGVMVVKNLERVPGTSAQAFHSLCDEYYPVVKRALFIFTMKVDKFHDNNLKFMEKFLHDRWRDIKDDTFYALFTRITSTVLPVVAEK